MQDYRVWCKGQWHTAVGPLPDTEGAVPDTVMSDPESETAPIAIAVATPPQRNNSGPRAKKRPAAAKKGSMKRPAAADAASSGTEFKMQMRGRVLGRHDSFSASLPNPLRLPLYCRTCGTEQACHGDPEQTCMRCGDNDFALVDSPTAGASMDE